jgi:hypothetical protein
MYRDRDHFIMSSIDASFLRAALVKVMWHPVPLRSCQALVLLAGLEHPGVAFTADEVLPGEAVGTDTHIAGITMGTLAGAGLITRVGRCKSPAPSRNGCWVNQWIVGRPSKAQAWLARNGFEVPSQQQELQLTAI